MMILAQSLVVEHYFMQVIRKMESATNRRNPARKRDASNRIDENLALVTDAFLEDRQRPCDPKRLQKTTVRSYRLALTTFDTAFSKATTENELRDEIRIVIDSKLSSTEKPMKPSGVNVYIRALNSFLTWCHQLGYLKGIVKIPLLKTPKRTFPRTISSSDIDRLKSFPAVTESQMRTKHMALVILDTGLRAEECLHVRESDIEWVGSRVWAYTKGNGESQRPVPLSSEGVKTLRRFLVEKAKRRKGEKVESINPYAFSTATGSAVSYRNSLRDLKKMGDRLGLQGLNWHTLRRTFATQYLQKRGLLTNLQQILGHADTRTTLLYLGNSIDEIVAAHDQFSALAA